MQERETLRSYDQSKQHGHKVLKLRARKQGLPVLKVLAKTRI
jgi:hypothetical protein